MARFRMYSVKDELTGKFMNPVYVEEADGYELANQIATRDFKSNVNNIPLWKSNPNDYSLYLVGIFDDETGAEATAIEKIIGGRSVVE